MNLGIIYCCWESADTLVQSISPWLAARESYLGGHTYTICVVACPFRGFPQPEALDQTVAMVRQYRAKGEIDMIVSSPSPITEVEARTSALTWLRDSQAVEATIMVDSDEVFTERDITGLTTFMEATPFVAWYRLSLTNLVFDAQTRLVEPFTPPRVHRMHLTSPFSLTATAFYEDNNVMYDQAPGVNRSVQRDTDLASMTVPPSACAPLHYSWLSNLRSKQKVEYQRSRWGCCSFKWSDVGGLSFDLDYFKERGLIIPTTAGVSIGSCLTPAQPETSLTQKS